MFPRKYPYYRNFSFLDPSVSTSELWSVGGRPVRFSLANFEGGVAKISLEDKKRWRKRREILAQPTLTPSGSGGGVVQKAAGQIEIVNAGGQSLLSLDSPSGFGVSGEASVWRFVIPDETEFYGMGEKNFGVLELSGIDTKFWNTDVWADFHGAQWENHPTDPPYASIPYLIMQTAQGWVGIAIDTYHPCYMKTPAKLTTGEKSVRVVELGQEGGEPQLWIFTADSLANLCRAFSRWHGTLPVPPIWTMGYHQSRWGYGGEADLFELNALFEEHGIPCDGLWLDIDYMDGYRCFSFDAKQFPHGPAHTTSALQRAGKRAVPILDPGIKQDENYWVYQDGVKAGIFCRNTEGSEFIGQVWPGETVFPDFSIPQGRKWWTQKVAEFVKNGFDGCWIDMNDPATGHVDPKDMLWGKGKDQHDAYRNVYALGMQVATLQGFLKAKPKQRPFILTRSASLGSGKMVAVWTGDNLSNRFYLKSSIPCSVNLSLCGVPMNGPDVGGFGGDSDEGLMLDWVKACFLFPFMRNHSTKESKHQEPWQYSDSAIGTIRRYIRLRYKFLPYLYQQYVAHEQYGDPILRPVFYEFPDIDAKWKNLESQFMVGPSVLQAPILDEEERIRDVFLPGPCRWYKDGDDWLKPGRYRVECDRSETPLYFREGAIIPMQRELPSEANLDLRKVAFHIFASSKFEGTSAVSYVADDGLTYDYKKGKQSEVKVSIRAQSGSLEIQCAELRSGYGPIQAEFVVYGEFKQVAVNGKPARLEPDRVGLTSRPNQVWRVVV